MRKKNPGFYPRPIKRTPSETPVVTDEWLDVQADFLKLEELIEAHGKLGGALHARNLYLEKDELMVLQSQFSVWRAKIAALLNDHTIKFPDDETIMYVGMQSVETGAVHTAFFKKKE